MPTIPEFKLRVIETESSLGVPNFRDLSGREVLELRHRIADFLLSGERELSPDNGSLARAILENAEQCTDILTSDEASPDLSCLDSVSTVDAEAFLSLDYFDEAAEMRLSDIKKYISWLWYRRSDDLIVVAADFDWMMFIDCLGAVHFAKRESVP